MYKLCKQILTTFLYLAWLTWPLVSLAADNNPSSTSTLGLGDVAENLLDSVNLFADFIHTACIIIGASFIFTSLIKYVEHKRSPLMVTLSTVVFLFLAGVVLLLLPLLPLITDSGVASLYY